MLDHRQYANLIVNCLCWGAFVPLQERRTKTNKWLVFNKRPIYILKWLQSDRI